MRYTFATLAAALGIVTATAFATSERSPAHILIWLPKNEVTTESLMDRLGRLRDVVTRYTSPDVPSQSRHLWRMAADGSGRCRLNADSGVRAPRWGAAGYVLYRQEADTNHDGRIDDLDEDLIKIIPADGGDPTEIGEGRSAAWSPDGRAIAIIDDGALEFRDLHGQRLGPAERPPGEVVLTNSLDPELAHDFWSVDVRGGQRRPLPDDLGRKYLWLAAQSQTGRTVLFPGATRENLLTMGADEAKPRAIDRDPELFIDPVWSPDERNIVFVSIAPGGETCGRH
jgi:hypothetical protein